MKTTMKWERPSDIVSALFVALLGVPVVVGTFALAYSFCFATLWLAVWLSEKVF